MMSLIRLDIPDSAISKYLLSEQISRRPRADRLGGGGRLVQTDRHPKSAMAEDASMEDSLSRRERVRPAVPAQNCKA